MAKPPRFLDPIMEASFHWESLQRKEERRMAAKKKSAAKPKGKVTKKK